MRKASHDGGDSTSVTSGFENEKKKPKKTSIKRKTPSFSQASDDTANEPLLQKDKEKPEAQSAKYFGIGKADRDIDNKVKPSTATTGFCGTTESLLSFKDTEHTKTTSTAPLHNYMNTNVFNTHENVKTNITTKSQILVEIDSSKQSGYSPSPLIFTTAKIHTDAKTKQMEPVHVTPVPILSTIEVSVSKGGTITTNEKKISNGSSVISPVYTPIPLNKNKEEKVATNNFNTILSPTSSKDVFAKTIPVTSATKVTPNTIVLSSFTPSALSSSNAKSTSNLQGTKDSKNNQMLPQYTPPEPKSLNLDSTRTNSTVKTIITSVPKGTSNLTASIKANQSNKAEKESNQNTSNIKSPTYTESSKSVYNTVASKQLQRQKTATEEISDTATTVIQKEQLKDASAKIPTTYSKSDSIFIKDNINTLSKTSANANNASIKPSSNTSSKSISNMSTTSTTTKPIVTSETKSNNVGLSSIGKNAMENSKNTVSSVNSISSNREKYASPTLPTTSTATVTKSTTSIAKPPDIATSMSAIKNSTVLSLQKSTPVNKTELEQNTASASDTTISLASTSSVTSKSAVTAKESAMTTTLSSQSMSNPTNKTTVTKALTVCSVTTSAKTSNATKLSQSTPQTSSTTPLVAVKVPVTMHIDVLGIVVTSLDTSTSQSVTSAIASKQATSAIAGSITTKPVITTSSVTPSTVSSKSAAVAVDIKSPNNNTSQTIVTAKPTNSIPKTESVTSSRPSSSTTSTMSTVKSPQVTSPASVPTKETTKKPALTKTQSATKSQPVTATNKTVASSTKTPSTEASTSPAVKKSSATAKTSTVTSAVKSPSSSVTKASAVTSTSSASASKLTTTSVSQVSAKKAVGVVGSSVPSTTPGLRLSESIKKSGSKSSENNKDVKNSKA